MLLTIEQFAERVGDKRKTATQRIKRWGLPTEWRRSGTTRYYVIDEKHIPEYIERRDFRKDPSSYKCHTTNNRYYHGDAFTTDTQWWLMGTADRLLKNDWQSLSACYEQARSQLR